MGGALGASEVLLVDGVSSCSGAETEPGERQTASGSALTGEPGSRLYSETQTEPISKQFHTSLK